MPPRTWRLRYLAGIKDETMGITSTYVENTGQKMTIKDWLEDHLHIRGEYPKFLKEMKPVSGSPPHTWRILNKSRYINDP